MTPDSTLPDEIRRFEEQYRNRPESLVFARLADAYRKAGEPARALELLEDGLTRHPDYPSGHIVLARALRDLGRLEEAVRSFRRVLELDAGNLVAVRELGSLADERGELEEARHWYEHLVQVDPANEAAARRLADLESPMGELAEKPASVPEPEGQPSGSEWWNDPPEGGHTGDVEVAPIDTEAPLEEDEVVAAILNGEVPRTIRAEDTWWYEERLEEEAPEPSAEADLLTRTMADLYAEQGLHAEAAAIYEELLRDSPDDGALRARLVELRDRADSPGPVAETLPQQLGAPEPPLEIPPEGTLPQPQRPIGRPVAEELRQILRRGEASAALLSESEGESVDAPQESSGSEPTPRSDFARDWLDTLEDHE